MIWPAFPDVRPFCPWLIDVATLRCSRPAPLLRGNMGVAGATAGLSKFWILIGISVQRCSVPWLSPSWVQCPPDFRTPHSAKCVSDRLMAIWSSKLHSAHDANCRAAVFCWLILLFATNVDILKKDNLDDLGNNWQPGAWLADWLPLQFCS